MDEAMLVSRRDELIEGEVDGELVALHVDRGLCFGFNTTATALWRELETPQTLGQLADTFTASHEVTREACLRDIAAALATLRDEGLVTITAAG